MWVHCPGGRIEPLAALPAPACECRHALRRAIVQVGAVASIGVLVVLSLPALKRRVAAGDAIQPAWGLFLERLGSRYGLPVAPRVRHVRRAGPLATLVVAYRSLE